MEGADEGLERVFEASIRFLNNAANSGFKTSHADRLRLYGYYKRIAEGPCIKREPPNNDLIALTKWRAWRLTSALSVEKAMRGYVQIVDSVAPGWRERDGLGTSARTERYTISGVMFYNNENDANWRSRYFTLEGKMLYEYMSFRDHYPCAVLYLDGCDVSLDAKLTNAVSPYGDNIYPVTISHDSSGQVFQLASPSLVESKKWVDALRQGVLLERNARQEEDNKHKNFEFGEQEQINKLIGTYVDVDNPLQDPNAWKDKAKSGMQKRKSFGYQEKEIGWKEVAARFEIPLEHATFVGELVEQCFRYIEDFDNFWEPSFEVDDIKCFSSRGTHPVPASLGRTAINAPGMAILDLLWDLGTRHTVDSLFDKGTTIEQLGPQTRIDHMVFKPVWPTSARDFCTLNHWRILEDGTTIVIVGKSVEDDSCPPKRDVIRAHIYLSGVVIKQISVEPPISEVYYIVQSDPMGSVPNVMTRKVQGRRPLILQKIRDIVEPAYKMTNERSRKHKASMALESLEFPKNGPKFTCKNSRRDFIPPGLQEETKPRSSSIPGEGLATKGRGARGRRRVTIPRKMHLSLSRSLSTTLETETLNDMCEGPNKTPPPQNARSVYSDILFLVVLCVVTLQIGSIPEYVEKSVTTIVLVFVMVQCYLSVLGTALDARRKVWMATWESPAASSVLVNIRVDVSKCKEWISIQREGFVKHEKVTQKPVSILHLVIKALGECLAENTEMNGHVTFGNFLPSKTSDISCLVIYGGSKANLVKIPAVDEVSVHEIANIIWKQKSKLIQGEAESLKGIPLLFANILPVWAIAIVIRVCCLFSCSFGINVPGLIQAFPFGVACVSDAGALGVEMVFPPTNPWASIPIQITMGLVHDAPVVVNGQVQVRPMMNLAANIDHRYMDATQGAKIASRLRQILQDPFQVFGTPHHGRVYV
mmetsp:Transcript_25030/g.40615  ORF Transcript_25030/g.40615 Transcript_25030/m.40615 type:complete len:931 (-) Transcript_25030:270-3062(-)|eukprot:CAMPEP_0203749878 /NCGR_PEP_ID=MMETSP0098-20131031/4258_1 /ASSEMBLY_ACC=CAM_ASM_000208 /TAXON_ID=96639 /ORGANISM=" , Strain NY0313808BC1" /LENGTH=930 /DNA_ID=CAMNT_0050638995 /DNA_START=151 /DNA_END=2943 /DNA_ORIENTATION=+